jgi:hypothetical protein
VGHVIALYLNHTRHEARDWALRFLALAERSLRGLSPGDRSALALAAATGLKDGHPQVRKLALTVLGGILPRVEPADRRRIALQLADGLDDASADVRRRAVDCLSSAVDLLDPEDWLEPVLRMRARLTDEDPAVSCSAVAAFEQIIRRAGWKDFVEAHFSSERTFCENFRKAQAEERRRYRAEQEAARPKYHYPPEEPRGAAPGPMPRPVRTASLENALKTLDLAYDAVQTHDDVRRAYRRCAARLHPDRNPGADNNRRFAALMGAYHLICAAFGFEIGFK